jgi:pilus assembly protein FimV
VRNLRLIITFWLASFAMPGISFALGLGGIDVSSFLNQPFKAEIEVISAEPGEIDDLLVTLASKVSFIRAGLSRPDYLSELRFVVKKNERGDQATILVSTKTAIREPFLNFLVEADWSKGRLFREFAVLLDPPFNADNSEPASSAALPSFSTTEEIAKPIASFSEVNTAVSTATEETTSVASIAATDSIVVEKGDTLWSIANQFKDSEHSRWQVMLATQRANPNAFFSNNINNLRAGAVLRAPTADELDQLNKQQAYAQVLEQNGLWSAHVGSVEGTSVSIASGDGGSNGADGKENVTGDFSLLAPGDGDSESAGQGEGSDANDFKTQLALAEEQLDASRLENQTMQSRIAELEELVSKFGELQKIVEIEDDSLAQLQADQSENLAVEKIEIAEEPSVVEPPAAVIVAETKQKEPSIFDGILPPSVINLVHSMSGVLDNIIPSMTGFVKSIVSATTGLVQSGVPGMTELVKDIVPAVSRLRDDPVTLGGLVGVVILLLGLILFRRRKSRVDRGDAGVVVSDVDLEEPFRMAEEMTPVNFANRGTDDDTKEYIDNEEDGFSDPAEAFQPNMAEHDDVLNEVDVYLAYGLYDKAEELLTLSLGANPGRADYRAKLLETYFATKNVDDFCSEAELLKSMGSAGEKYWDKVQIMGYELAPNNALFSVATDSSIRTSDFKVAKPEKTDIDLDATEDDTNFLTTDFNLDADSNDLAETQAIKAVADTQELPDITGFVDSPQVGNDLSDELEEVEFSFDPQEEVDVEIDVEVEVEVDVDVEDISDISFEISDDFLESAESNYPDGITTPDEVDISDIGDLMLPDDVDEVSTKLDLARAFIDMGDAEGARSSLEEVLAEGTEEQKAEATQLLEKM